MNKKILCPNRIRCIKGSFAFIEHRFLQNGYMEGLHHNELILYIFLILVSDRNGLSWYAYDKICSILCMPLESYIEARNGLIDKNLIATDGYMFQVLSLPDQPVVKEKKLLKTNQDMDKYDPATIRYYGHQYFNT